MENNPIPVMEGYPDHIIERIILRDQRRKNGLPEALNGHPVQLVLEDLLLWDTGVLSVSFKGGTGALHKNIADTAAAWSKYANIQFDFGENASSGSYRAWVPGDTSSIRVGFEAPGYWAFVGTDSLDPEICKPGEITLIWRSLMLVFQETGRQPYCMNLVTHSVSIMSTNRLFLNVTLIGTRYMLIWPGHLTSGLKSRWTLT